MNVTREYPPNIDETRAVFPVDQATVYAYGGNLYVPEYDGEIPADLLVHEQWHQKQQQGGGPEAWWRRYLGDLAFRFNEEAEAYAAQYLFVKKTSTNAIAKECLFDLASNLSSSLYQMGVPYGEAERAILRKARNLVP